MAVERCGFTIPLSDLEDPHPVILENIFEDMRRNAYRVALKEMRESVAALEIAEAMRYVRAGDAMKSNAVDQIIGTLVNIARKA